MGESFVAIRYRLVGGLFLDWRSGVVDCSRVTRRNGVWTDHPRGSSKYSYLVGFALRHPRPLGLLSAIYDSTRANHLAGAQFSLVGPRSVRGIRAVFAAVETGSDRLVVGAI